MHTNVLIVKNCRNIPHSVERYKTWTNTALKDFQQSLQLGFSPASPSFKSNLFHEGYGSHTNKTQVCFFYFLKQELFSIIFNERLFRNTMHYSRLML